MYKLPPQPRFDLKSNHPRLRDRLHSVKCTNKMYLFFRLVLQALCTLMHRSSFDLSGNPNGQKNTVVNVGKADG